MYTMYTFVSMCHKKNTHAPMYTKYTYAQMHTYIHINMYTYNTFIVKKNTVLLEMCW